MFYFVNQTIPTRLTGIESAQFKRIKMLLHQHAEAKLITQVYDRTYVRNVVTYGLKPEDVVNLYDFFCDIKPTLPKPLQIADLNLPDFDRQVKSDGLISYFLAGRLLFRVYLFGDGEVDKVTYYGSNRKAVRTENFDIRGFHSSTTMYDADIHMAKRVFYNIQGETKLILNYRFDEARKINVVTGIVRYQANGRIRFYDDRTEMLTDFLDELNSLGTNNVFVSDRTARVGYGMGEMRTKAFRLVHIHSTHVNDMDDLFSNNFNSNYRYAFLNNNKFNGLIASTKAQVADLQNKFPEQNIYRASVSIIPDEQLATKRISLNLRTPFKIIAVARINPEKRLDEVVRIFAMVHQEIPSAVLEIWGFVVDKKENEKLKHTIQELQLNDVVKLMGYSTDMDSVYNDAQLLFVTSSYEGTALVIAEAQAHGVPVIAYDFHYGPREFIIPGKNGDIVPVDDRRAAANSAIKLLKNKEIWQQASDNAYELSNRSSEEEVFKSWQVIAEAAREFYRKGE